MENSLYNSEFNELVNSDDFVRFVNEAQDADKFLADLILQYPGNCDNLRYAVEFILFAQMDKKQIPLKESEIILMNLQDKFNKEKSHKSIFRRLGVLKIASSILILISVGVLIFYSQVNQDPLKQFAAKHEDEGVILLSDGSKHFLSKSELNIDYNSNNGEVIVQNGGTFIEKLENKVKKKEELLNQIIVPYGQRQRVVLNDGTSVELNADSKLIFPAVFSGKTRTVYLQGEGYFEVSKDDLHPFIVKTSFMNIEVHGTVFNLTVYEDESVASAVLVEGSVSVTKSGKIFRNQALLLSPGEGCFYSVENEKMVVKDIDVDLYTSWKNGVYQFENVPLSIVLKRVMKYYNVQINVQDMDILDEKLTGKLRITGSIDDVIQYISKTLECRCEKEVDGGYSLYKY